MAKQRYIKDSFWTDPYVEDLDPSEKLMFIYLLTNPLCNVAGIYEIQTKRIAYETGFEKEMVLKILSRFEKDKKLITKDSWIIIANFAKNQSTNPNIKAGMQRIIDDLPESIKALKGFESLPYFTLLNLTLPNLTKHNQEETKTPAQSSKDFFNSKGNHEILDFFKGKINEDTLRQEIQKFVLYWTEPNGSGTKERWQLERTFDVKRRLATWLQRNKEWGQQKTINKSKTIIGLHE